jgi:hypothetical protein
MKTMAVGELKTHFSRARLSVSGQNHLGMLSA